MSEKPTLKQRRLAQSIAFALAENDHLTKEMVDYLLGEGNTKDYYRQWIAENYEEYKEFCAEEAKFAAEKRYELERMGKLKPRSASNYYGDCDAIYADAIDYFGDASMYY